MVFGDKNSFDSKTILNIKDSGVIYIMVVSGTNIVLVVDNKVKVIVCDVGKGGAILLTYKNWQMLIDMGLNNKKVLSCLSVGKCHFGIKQLN
jgi:beta-lactamase superfamily II metal-dependent hydrolase